jgi:hypothetical protein
VLSEWFDAAQTVPASGLCVLAFNIVFFATGASRGGSVWRDRNTSAAVSDRSAARGLRRRVEWSGRVLVDDCVEAAETTSERIVDGGRNRPVQPGSNNHASWQPNVGSDSTSKATFAACLPPLGRNSVEYSIPSAITRVTT